MAAVGIADDRAQRRVGDDEVDPLADLGPETLAWSVDRCAQVVKRVQIGIQGDQGTEIKSGLNEGDTVVIATPTGGANSTQTRPGGGIGGGGFGGGGGGRGGGGGGRG